MENPGAHRPSNAIDPRVPVARILSPGGQVGRSPAGLRSGDWGLAERGPGDPYAGGRSVGLWPHTGLTPVDARREERPPPNA